MKVKFESALSEKPVKFFCPWCHLEMEGRLRCEGCGRWCGWFLVRTKVKRERSKVTRVS